MYSTYNEGKSAVAERFIWTLKNKIFKHMAAVSKNVYFDLLKDFLDKYNYAVHRSIKMKRIDITPGSYTEYNEGSKEKDPKFKVGYHVRISEYKKILLKDTLKIGQDQSKLVFVVSKIENTVPQTYVNSGLNGEPITESFYEKELHKKKNSEKVRIEKVLKRKGDKLYVFSSWIDEKNLV